VALLLHPILPEYLFPLVLQGICRAVGAPGAKRHSVSHCGPLGCLPDRLRLPASDFAIAGLSNSDGISHSCTPSTECNVVPLVVPVNFLHKAAECCLFRCAPNDVALMLDCSVRPQTVAATGLTGTHALDVVPLTA